MRLKSENYDVESKNRADRNSHAQEGENMKDQSDEMFAETEQWKEVVGNLQILQKTMNNEEARNSTIPSATFR